MHPGEVDMDLHIAVISEKTKWEVSGIHKIKEITWTDAHFDPEWTAACLASVRTKVMRRGGCLNAIQDI